MSLSIKRAVAASVLGSTLVFGVGFAASSAFADPGSTTQAQSSDDERGIGKLVSEDQKSDAVKELLDSASKTSPLVKREVSWAVEQLGTDYSWAQGGAQGPTEGSEESAKTDKTGDALKYGDDKKKGFDCAGLVSGALENAFGDEFHIPDDKLWTGEILASLESKGVKKVDSLSDAAVGDVVFYQADNEEHPSHVAIYAGDSKVIESPASGYKVSVRESRSSKPVVAVFKVSEIK